MGVWAVWTDCLDLNLPKLCLFTLRSIKENEELTFDYTNFGGSQSNSEDQATQSIASKESTTKRDECLTNDENDENLNDLIKNATANGNCDEFDNDQIIQTIILSSDEEGDEDDIMNSPKPNKSENSLNEPKTSSIQDGFACRCGAPNCRKIIFC